MERVSVPGSRFTRRQGLASHERGAAMVKDPVDHEVRFPAPPDGSGLSCGPRARRRKAAARYVGVRTFGAG